MLDDATPIADRAEALASTAHHLTYNELEAFGRSDMLSRGRSPQQVANMLSALHAWTRHLQASGATSIREELASDFDRHFLRFQDDMTERLAPRTQKDRAEQILQWKGLYQVARRLDTLPATFSAALVSAIAKSGQSRAAIARATGMNVGVLHRWAANQGMPHPSSFDEVLRLERALSLPPETLISRLPSRRLGRYQRGARESSPSPYSQRVARNLAAVGNYGQRPTPRIQDQWQNLLVFKTEGLFPQASKHNTWRVKTPAATGSTVKWSMVCRDGMICATGGADWGFISSYLGFLALPAPIGPGLASGECDTLAWLAHPGFVKRYVQWLRMRCDGRIHNGAMTFLSKVTCHLRPHTGYLWSYPNLGLTLPSTIQKEFGISEYQAGSLTTAWQAHCEASRKEIVRYHRDLKARFKVTPSRDPKHAVSRILSDRFPLKGLEVLIQSLESDAPPVAHARDYAAWIRDVLLLRMLLTNPLRVSQFSVMRHRADGTGNLYQTTSGQWRLRFNAEDFKNEKGAAQEPYDSPVDETVWPWILRYLSESRPYLIGAKDTDYVFLPSAEGPRKGNALVRALGVMPTGVWTAEGVGNRVRVLTERLNYPDGGFRPHAFRHIIATDHLRRHPRDYLTVAKLLHDTIETVICDYGHLEVEDGLRVLHDGVRQAREELTLERRGRLTA